MQNRPHKNPSSAKGRTPGMTTTYTPMNVDRDNLTILGVPFPDLKTLDEIHQAIMTNVYEGFEPDKRDVEIIRDYCLDKITFQEMLKATKEHANGLCV
jgi:hypothetical protein